MNLWSVEHFLTIFVITFGFGVALLLHPPKSDDKNGQEMFNWSELHSERSNFLQNPYFNNIFKISYLAGFVVSMNVFMNK